MQKYNKNAIKYMKEKCDQLNLTLPKGTKDLWKQYAESKGMPLTALIKQLMAESMENDNFKTE